MDYLSIIDQYYPSENELRRILLTHSRQVADRCLLIARKHPELKLDTEFLEEAAMLHDIGILYVDAPSISCYGTEPYICHGLLGAELLRREGLPAHARVAERHTGTGLTQEEILRQSLPLPPRDLVPETLEEKIICYADKFYSKSHLEMEKTPEQVIRSLQKFGLTCVDTFRTWMSEFE